MTHTNKTPLLVLLGTVLIAGTAACLFLFNCFNEGEFNIDTHDEHNDDYL
jgi:hypothetical protein